MHVGAPLLAGLLAAVILMEGAHYITHHVNEHGSFSLIHPDRPPSFVELHRIIDQLERDLECRKEEARAIQEQSDVRGRYLLKIADDRDRYRRMLESLNYDPMIADEGQANG